MDARLFLRSSVYLKEIANDPLMRQMDWQVPFIINLSASSVSISKVLMQNDTMGRAHPIHYASRLLNDCETRYSISEHTFLSLWFSSVKFKHYIAASSFSIIVQSDQDVLKQIMQQADPIGRTARLLASLQQFDFIFQQPKIQRVNYAKLI